MKNKKILIVIIVVLILVGITTFLCWKGYIPNIINIPLSNGNEVVSPTPVPINNTSPTSTPEVNYEEELAKHMLTYTENGEVYLYDVMNSSIIDRVDLKNFTEFVEHIVTTKSVKKEVTNPIANKKKEKVVEKKTDSVELTKGKTYGKFTEIYISVVKGDSAWEIQEKLTPNEKTYKMIEIVRELNKGREMKWIYPGDKLLFLIETTKVDEAEEIVEDIIGEDVTTIEEEETENVVNTEEIISERTVEMTASLGADAIFDYYEDYETGTLYAYNGITHSFYKISAKGEFFTAEVLLTNSNVEKIKTFRVIDDVIYFLNDNADEVNKIMLSSPGQVISKKLSRSTMFYEFDNHNFYYIIGDKLYKYDLKANKETYVDLETTPYAMYLARGKLFMYSINATDGNPSILQINQTDLTVEDSILIINAERIPTIDVTMNILTDSDKARKKVIYAYYIPNNLSDDIKNKVTLDNKNIQIVLNEGFYYIMQENKVIISYPDLSLLKSIPIEGINFMPL